MLGCRFGSDVHGFCSPLHGPHWYHVALTIFCLVGRVLHRVTPFYVSLCCWNTPTYPSTEELNDGWHADDASACGEFPNLLDLPLHHGPSYGDNPNPSKYCLIVDQISASHCFVLRLTLYLPYMQGLFTMTKVMGNLCLNSYHSCM